MEAKHQIPNSHFKQVRVAQDGVFHFVGFLAPCKQKHTHMRMVCVQVQLYS